MTMETMASTIRSRFDAQVATPQSLTVAWDNAPFSEPASGLWARFSVLPGESFQAEMGATKTFRYPGVAMAQLFDDVEKGTKDLLELADAVVQAFRAISVSGVIFKSPYLVNAGRDGRFYQVNVVCPFQFDETVAG